MARYWCERCKQESNTLDEPHLCADLKKRYERNKKAVDSIVQILRDNELDLWDRNFEDVAVKIIKALAGRDLGVE